MKINRHQLHDRLHYYLLILYAISLPYFLHLGNYVLALLLLNWLVEGEFKAKLGNLAKSTPAKLIIGLLVLFAISLLYSTNMKEGLGDIERKLVLLILPVIIFSKQPFNSQGGSKILLFFAVSCVVATTVALLVAIPRYFSTGDTELLFYHQLSGNIGMHAIYLSCYLCFSIFIFIEHFRRKNLLLRSVYGFGLIVFILYISFLLALLASKTILVAFSAVLCFYFLYIFSGDKKNLKRGILLVVIINVLVGTTIMVTPYIRNRFEETFNSKLDVLHQERFEPTTEFTGLSLRLVFWKMTFEILNEDKAWIFGVGTGDSQDKLASIYRRYNLYEGDGKEDVGYLGYNTHSLFFEVLLKLGLIGLFYLIALLGYILYRSLKQREALLLVWLLIFVFFSLTEATLQTNKGVVFFAFLYCILLNTKPKVEETQKEEWLLDKS